MDKKITGKVLEHEKLKLDSASLKKSLANRLVYSVGKDDITAKDRDWLHALTYMVRDRLIERWMETMRSYYVDNRKRVYYLSLEFLIGRTLSNSLLNMGFMDECLEALNELGLDYDLLSELENDAALGNGGLGRLAACFLDSMATLDIPGYGYGIRYEYGMFHQCIENGYQIEHPDNWLRYGNPWEFSRPEVLYPVKFYGRIVQYKDEMGITSHHWVDTEEIMAMAYDTPIPGFETETVNNMRLWSAKASRDFDLGYFNEGNYIKAVEDKNESENLSKVLYPDDTTEMGRELRLKQQYFFVCASLQDILYRFSKFHIGFKQLPDKVAIQLNDTHPSIAIPELMRVLVDIHKQDWDTAWDITLRTFAYTNHTLMPEALETWPIPVLEKVLPRHMEIIFEINRRFLEDVMHHYPGDTEKLKRMSLIGEEGGRHVRMAHLAIVGSHKVNGVAALHTKLMKETIFTDFSRFYPDRIINKTNGITPRRWLNHANPKLAKLICKHIGHGWVTNLDELKKLVPYAEKPDFVNQFQQVKHENKKRLAELIESRLQLKINPDSLFDVQIKRIHEYKRQLLNVLHIVTLYNRIRNNPDNNDIVPRTVIFSGKAAPGYVMAKLIIKLINDVANIVNNDPAIHDTLKVVFIPNFDVSTAEDIIPAADLSEQISTAGTEASGTGNMKMALNGALTIGTLDGANIEIMEEVGEENIFIFGLNTNETTELRNNQYNPDNYYQNNPELKQTLGMISSGFFSPDQSDRYKPIIDSLLDSGDQYLLLADYEAYIDCQRKVEELYLNPQDWYRRTVLNVANMGKFSSDRTIREYAEEIWGLSPAENLPT
ncbi:MAG: glycogen/starch/alpha-glucan phosphorylase [Gammaproteobacteria bacterium]|nr:glycogen/starch/alpha-glucan phosphorylase [Gammaproteobacteria bacterium]